jgi:hypothetical protein
MGGTTTPGRHASAVHGKARDVCLFGQVNREPGSGARSSTMSATCGPEGTGADATPGGAAPVPAAAPESPGEGPAGGRREPGTGWEPAVRLAERSSAAR